MTTTTKPAKALKSPYPYFGGKSTVAPLVWSRFGNVRNFVDPFVGSLAMLLGRPAPWEGTETVNDADSFIANFWRAVQADPEAVAKYADWPVNESDLHARHVWLVGERDSITAKVEGDPEWFDAKVAGWWCWGICCWIGSEWCSGNGPWQSVVGDDGVRRLENVGNAGMGVHRTRVNLGNAGMGVHRTRVNLGNAGRGVNRNLVHLGDAGRGVNRQRGELSAYFAELCVRLRNVRVCCGDWSRVCGDTPTIKQGLTGIFLDPPYADTAKRTPDLYRKESTTVAHAVREWAIERGDNPKFRIALCGYEGEHVMPDTWECVAWKARGGYANRSETIANAKRERIWFSPHCLRPVSNADGLFSLGEKPTE